MTKKVRFALTKMQGAVCDAIVDTSYRDPEIQSQHETHGAELVSVRIDGAWVLL